MKSNLRSLSRSFMSGIKSAESSATALSTDKNVLYIMLVIAVVNVVGYLMMGNFEAVVFFAIVAYLSTFFTKNMVIVFLVSILATNFLMVSKVNYFSRMTGVEGMQTKSGSEDEDPKPTGKPTGKPTPTPTGKPTPTPTGKPTPKPTKSDSKKTSAEGMNGKLAPAKFNDDNDDDDDASSAPFLNGTSAQKNAQMEKAHDALQSMGNGTMQVQTEEVLKQQKMLMDNIKVMQPFLETAERFLDKFNMKGIDGLLGKIGMGGGATPGPSS